jgi:hypothetical protein
MRRRISAKTFNARFNRIFREPTLLDSAIRRQKMEKQFVMIKRKSDEAFLCEVRWNGVTCADFSCNHVPLLMAKDVADALGYGVNADFDVVPA